jgi:hypothetical protein
VQHIHEFIPSIAQSVERRTVVIIEADILRSLVQIRLEGGFFYITLSCSHFGSIIVINQINLFLATSAREFLSKVNEIWWAIDRPTPRKKLLGNVTHWAIVWHFLFQPWSSSMTGTVLYQ